MNNKLTSAVNWALNILGVYMIYQGLTVAYYTTGYVQGSEFGMQITLVHLVALIVLWIALSFFRTLLVKTEQA